MRIGVHLGSPNPQGGGGFTFAQEICNALMRVAPESKHDFVLFHGANFSISANGIKNVTFISLLAPMHRRIYNKSLRIFRNALKVLVGKEVSIEHYFKIQSAHEKQIEDSELDLVWYVGSFCYTKDIPYLFTVLDLQHLVQPYFPEISNEGAWDSREIVYTTEMRRAAFVIVSTNVGKAEIEHFYRVPSGRIFVLPYAALPFEYVPDDKSNVLAKYALQPNYLFYPAQFWPQKNHVGLLHAIRLLRDKWNITLPAVFVGSDKGNMGYIKRLIEQLKLSDQVFILGFVPREDLIALYQHALALTMPTLVGPDNIPALEAFALRCPVITSNLPGFEEQLGDAALLVNPKDEEQIALAIKSIYDDIELRQRLIEKGLERIRRWTWDDYVRAVFKIIDDFEPIRRSWSPGSGYKLR